MTIYLTPYRRMAHFREAMNRFMEEALPEAPAAEREMPLAVDVRATDEAYTITALTPGLETKDLDIEILNDTVTLRGEFKSLEGDGVKYLCNELPVGRFSRTLNLSTALDAAKSEASLKNGVLTLRVPKVEAERPKSIRVKSA
ncbi:MAG: Hsp20/alpha crystallin family protein [Anaerolineales bacterium]|nr:Hsp20/alpha crystallin family protein [Anaerolineales bacterium]